MCAPICAQRCRGVKACVQETAHVVCKPCLERWFRAQQDLRSEKGLGLGGRRSCPVCRCELRTAAGAVRGEAQFAMGLRKVEGTWQ